MPLPGVDSVDTLGGGLLDYDGIAVIDGETDRSAAAVNRMAADTAGMTDTAIRAWCRMTMNGASAPTLVAYDTNWGSDPATAAAPVLAYVSTGIFTVTFPAQVPDLLSSETVSGAGTPGYVGPTPLNFRDGWGKSASLTTAYTVQVAVTSANVLTFAVFAAGSLANPSSGTLSVWGI